MKKNVLLLILILMGITTHAQEYQSYLQKKTNEASAENKDFLLRAIQDENGFTTIFIDSGTEEVAKFLIKPFSYELFKAKLSNILSTKKELQLLENNDAILNSLYTKINSYFHTVNERPQAATIYLKYDNIPIYAQLEAIKPKTDATTKEGKEEKEKYKLPIGKLTDPTVEITFYSGFIEKIAVKGKFKDTDLTFVNKYSIGVSSLNNIENFQNIVLYSLYETNLDIKNYDISQIKHPQTEESIGIISPNRDRFEDVKEGSILNNVSNTNLLLYLNDVINYQRIIDVNANDISPTKQKIILDNTQKEAKLFREESTKLLEAIIFTDLLGTFDEDNPNGIIQTEIAKRFNINTNRHNVNKWWGILFLPLIISESWGSFEYIDAKVLLSKIEDDNKYLTPNIETNKLELISLYQHRNFAVGGNLNGLALENQNLKFNMFLDIGFEFSKSGFKLEEDSKDVENLNFMEFNTSLKFHLFPEKRYGLYITDKLSYFETLNDEAATLQFDETSYWLNTVEFQGYLDISTSAKLFARYNFIHQVADIDNNFSQFQLGTAFYILSKNRKDK